MLTTNRLQISNNTNEKENCGELARLLFSRHIDNRHKHRIIGGGERGLPHGVVAQFAQQRRHRVVSADAVAPLRQLHVGVLRVVHILRNVRVLS